MKILGINCLNHDAALTVIHDNEIVFAGHTERYSGIKNDSLLNDEIVNEALSHEFDEIVYYEFPYLKKSRQLYSLQFGEVFNTKNLPSLYLKKWLKDYDVNYVEHHKSHAAAGYYTSPFNEAIVLCIDGIGEWDTITLWEGKDGKLKKLESTVYPHSLGLFYTAITHRLGLKPCEEEYILMGMAGWGKPIYKQQMMDDFFESSYPCKLKFNLHKGCSNYHPEWNDFDIAASAQAVLEDVLEIIVKSIKEKFPNKDFVFCGGVALNCVANSLVIAKYYPNVWIMPNPGDAGSSLGAAAAFSEKKLNWKTPFLGTEITGEYPVEEVLKELLDGRIVGVANGKAEFGPRALGNRSLLADPRGPHTKDKVNEIKRRAKFRPFAPSILEEYAHEYFELPVSSSPYMQFTAMCKYPEKYPAICHVDGTSRVQTVSEKDNPGFYSLIKEFYNKTGCPMLLNTSLNIKGKPIVNNRIDALEFEKKYNVKVL